MGLLTVGTPLTWEETKALAEHVRYHGVEQFINLFKKLEDRTGDVLKWGDEVEYIIVKFDDENERATVSLRAKEILPQLQEKENNDPHNVKTLWRPEYAAYMVEGTPGKPYGSLLAHLNIVEANMRYRRQEASAFLQPGEVLMSITNFPRLGCPNFTVPPRQPTPQEGVSRSMFLPDDCIFPAHPRYKTLTSNIRNRRGEKVAINIPVFPECGLLLRLQWVPSHVGIKGNEDADRLAKLAVTDDTTINLAVMKKTDPPNCDKCNVIEDVQHLLWECVKYKDKREDLSLN